MKRRKRRKQRYTVGRDGPRPVDVYVGRRVRRRRVLAGMSQDQLGERLGLTFQQVQKYECGSNRISASKLWDISNILGVPISWFFEGSEKPKVSKKDKEIKQEALGLSRAFNSCSKKERKVLLALFKATADYKV